MRSWRQRIWWNLFTYIPQNFSFHRTCLYIQGHDRENTPNSSLTKGCLIWSTIFVVESFYNRKIKFVDIGISGKGIVCWHLLTRDVYVWQPKHCSSEFIIKYNEVCSNNVYKFVYKKLNRDGVEVIDIWWRIYGTWICGCGYMIINIWL